VATATSAGQRLAPAAAAVAARPAPSRGATKRGATNTSGRAVANSRLDHRRNSRARRKTWRSRCTSEAWSGLRRARGCQTVVPPPVSKDHRRCQRVFHTDMSTAQDSSFPCKRTQNIALASVLKMSSTSFEHCNRSAWTPSTMPRPIFHEAYRSSPGGRTEGGRFGRRGKRLSKGRHGSE